MRRLEIDQDEIDRVMVSYASHTLGFPCNQLRHTETGVVLWNEPETQPKKLGWFARRKRDIEQKTGKPQDYLTVGG